MLGNEKTEQDVSVYRVVTLAEAAHMWAVPARTIMYHLLRDRIAARKAGKAWLVSVSSMLKFYGEPKKTYLDKEV